MACRAVPCQPPPHAASLADVSRGPHAAAARVSGVGNDASFQYCDACEDLYPIRLLIRAQTYRDGTHTPAATPNGTAMCYRCVRDELGISEIRKMCQEGLYRRCERCRMLRGDVGQWASTTASASACASACSSGSASLSPRGKGRSLDSLIVFICLECAVTEMEELEGTRKIPVDESDGWLYGGGELTEAASKVNPVRARMRRVAEMETTPLMTREVVMVDGAIETTTTSYSLRRLCRDCRRPFRASLELSERGPAAEHNISQLYEEARVRMACTPRCPRCRNLLPSSPPLVIPVTPVAPEVDPRPAIRRTYSTCLLSSLTDRQSRARTRVHVIEKRKKAFRNTCSLSRPGPVDSEIFTVRSVGRHGRSFDI